jgi:broad specificity phosphatase PhoE
MAIKAKANIAGEERKLVDLQQHKPDLDLDRLRPPETGDVAAMPRQSVIQRRRGKKSAVAVANTQDRPMIVIARHGRPALDRHIWINSEEYVTWWAAYDAGGLAEGQRAPNGLVEALRACKLVVSSSLLRARQTAAMAAPERDIQIEPRFVEAPLPPPHLPDFIKFRPRFWGVVARATWYFGYSRDQETRSQAEVRADEGAAWLIEQAIALGSVGLLAHGWFNRMLRTSLEARGWECIYDGHDSHWSHRIYRLKAG